MITRSDERVWWRDAVVYQVYVRSFADANGDGIGDLEGIRSRLDHLASLGVDAVWITPFYPSPGHDHGYDVADYYDINPIHGSLADFDAMLAEAHSKNIRVIVDLVPNHTSNEHVWFKSALANPTGPDRDKYLFRDSAPDGGPPNNWGSVFGGPAWTKDQASQQWYLHLFAPQQPDLNWRNPAVADEFDRVLRFWYDRGVDGIRIDVAHGLLKAEGLPDNPPRPERERPLGAGGVGTPVGDEEGPLPTGGAAAATEPEPAAEPEDGATHYENLQQLHSFDQEEVHEVYRRWRTLVDSYPGDRMLVGEVFLWDPERVARYVRADELHLAFNFFLLGQPWDPAQMRRAIDLTLTELAAVEATPTWVLSNHDVIRHATRYGGGALGLKRARAATLLLLALPGAAFVYQGEELGLEEVDVPPEARQDPVFFNSGNRAGRDGCRVPIPWTVKGAPGFGFSSGTPWMPTPAGWGTNSVEALEADADSILHLYRHAIVARPQLIGDDPEAFAWAEDKGKGCLTFDRGPGGGLCAFNAGDQPVEIQLDGRSVLLASHLDVVANDTQLTLPPNTSAWLT